MGMYAYPLRMRLTAAVSRLFSEREYTVRRGLLRGMRRHGGLGWIPSAHLSLEEQWFAAQDFTGDVVYDVGAFHGLMSLHFARTASMVYAFEPHPQHQQIIAANVRINALDKRVVVVPYGASDHDGEAVLMVDPLLPGTATADPRIAAAIHGKQVSIALRAIDGLKLPPPSFVKVDVEGMELPALKGMERTLREHHPRLVVEIHGADAPAKRENALAVIAFLREAGYTDQRWLESNTNASDAWDLPASHLVAQ